MLVAVLAAAHVTYGCASEAGDAPSEEPRFSGPTYVHLESEPGDYLGGGATYTYTQADSHVYAYAIGGHAIVYVHGDERWYGNFDPSVYRDRIVPGTYENLDSEVAVWPEVGRLAWSRETRGCGTTTGSFTVHAVSYAGSELVGIDLSFEQRCEGATAALRGRVRWNANDPTMPPGPEFPPPPHLWQPDPSSLPASGNYVHLESDPGDPVGSGATYTHVPADSWIRLNTTGRILEVVISGEKPWVGEFETTSAVTRLEPGYYGGLTMYDAYNPVRGGLRWFGSPCSTVTGWFAVDAVEYSSDDFFADPIAIDLRFEQHCDGEAPALRGKIHWDTRDVTMPPGPVWPPPVDLWRPPDGSTPSSGNHVYLTSEPGDPVGGGLEYLYTPDDASISVRRFGEELAVDVTWGDLPVQGWWDGRFFAMGFLDRVEPGYYPGLEGSPFHDIVRGGMDWYGSGGRSCYALTGWFVVDAVEYSSSEISADLAAIDLRFEQLCDGSAAPLRGAVHWVAP